jgi:hypothetical protein
MLLSYLTDWFQCSPSQGVQRTGFIIHQLIGGTFRGLEHNDVSLNCHSTSQVNQIQMQKSEKAHSIYNMVLILALVYIYELLIISSISLTSFTAVVKLT